MAEYLKREALEKKLNERLAYLLDKNGPYDHFTDGYDEAVSTVEEFPAADVVPVVHGRLEDTGKQNDTWMCSACGERVGTFLAEFSAYCYHCGAKMDGGTT